MLMVFPKGVSIHEVRWKFHFFDIGESALLIYAINLILQMFWAKKCVECHLSFTSSALDAESERVVQEALDKVTKGFKFTSIHS